MALPNNPAEESLVVRILREHRQNILAMEAGQMQTLAQAWVQVEAGIQTEIQALVLEINASGGSVTAGQLARMERYQRLLAQAEGRSQVFINAATQQITDYQATLTQFGINDAVEATRAVYFEGGQIGAYFDVLPFEAVENLVGVTADGTPLGVYLEQTFPQATEGMKQALIDGVAQGLEPDAIAKNMVDGFGAGFRTVINMTRTEPLKAYRAASQSQYEQSGVVSGWKRLAAHDSRVCPGCLFTEGEFYENLDEFSEHNQGRCTAVPVVMDVNEPDWVSGAAWFELQDEETQRSILGPGRLEAWKDGAGLNQMVKRVSDPVWGGAFVPTPVGEINQ